MKLFLFTLCYIVSFLSFAQNKDGVYLTFKTFIEQAPSYTLNQITISETNLSTADIKQIDLIAFHGELEGGRNIALKSVWGIVLEGILYINQRGQYKDMYGRIREENRRFRKTNFFKSKTDGQLILIEIKGVKKIAVSNTKKNNSFISDPYHYKFYKIYDTRIISSYILDKESITDLLNEFPILLEKYISEGAREELFTKYIKQYNKVSSR